MSKNKNKVQAVESTAEYGIYVWILPNGEPFMDDDGNTLNVPSVKYDIKKMKALADAAAYYGHPDGQAMFMPGVGRATATQYQEDIERMASGYTPYGDTGNWRELFKNARK
jgi:hypothetical protein